MTRSFHVGQPFTTPDAEIATALEQVSIPTLLLSLVHITGDARYIREFKQAGLFLNEVQGFMSEEDKARVREVALPVIADYRDRGCPVPEPLPAALVREMMDWAACEPVDDDNVPLMLEELDLEGVDPRRPATLEDTRDFRVIVIGCGESGVLAGVRLKQAGIDFTIIEKNAGPGGTWWENSYPGARVDVANHFYCYSFEPSNHWDHFFAEQPELRQYFRDVVDRHELEPNIRWNTEVVSAAWDGEMWNVTVRSAAGTEILQANAVITAVGQLNRPQIPDFPGAETFAGPAFHSAAWDHDVDVTGKRVALIGAGASGFQIAPAIADKVEHLTVFQRTAQWMFPNPMYHEPVADGVRWAMEHLPYYGRWYRFLLLWPGADKGLDAARVDPDYDDQGNAVSEINAIARIMFTDWITTQVGDDPELLAKVMPDYPATGKRTLQDNGSWLSTLKRDNVELIRTPIERITPTGIVTADGQTYDADIIVYATGFRATDVLFPMTIAGRDGIDLRDAWGQRPYAYRGITVPGFPNFFMTYGPGTHLAHGGSLILNSELQMRYINQCLEHLITEGLRTMEPLPEPTKAWHQRSQEAIRLTVWAQPSIKHSYFKNADGEIHTVSPWRLSEYRSAIDEPVWSDFTVQEA
ncbi:MULTISPECIES: flavin-containing monooxygenase [Mycolicibacterium]|uniref:Putative flavoprotein involved in K+ transport n=1 Tax=Mycolicibacterium senegalense TaxID=1796 RepID=A0A378W7J6_9MYCO|nr:MULTISPECIES: NAD(P)/FAD-dependent oxidoreductase [Mycolicibacterium]MCV7336114.1 NAD(P)/FAD-dependent oxidoreductase [Mycolicibacterium senegalense]MDR7287879.1 4-hydroxyacetophenone monooxygenase [Mycolicibacterium senegalense]QZA24888.1 NAD(P)/FAD-dependent oxidoreductase [Mycolicibacterium senegalense]CDP86714.1 4-hydroxyacetophenone monooxygenase [Mycolicibacterium farcinogenes]SUA28544.1 putative flavoprotein involved in K+ transport [Mycolicibacterium senegalense]